MATTTVSSTTPLNTVEQGYTGLDNYVRKQCNDYSSTSGRQQHTTQQSMSPIQTIQTP